MLLLLADQITTNSKERMQTPQQKPGYISCFLGIAAHHGTDCLTYTSVLNRSTARRQLHPPVNTFDHRQVMFIAANPDAAPQNAAEMLLVMLPEISCTFLFSTKNFWTTAANSSTMPQ